MKSGDILTLTGKTLVGRNKVNEGGSLWEVLRVDFPVWAGGKEAALVQSVTHPEKARWVLLPEDRQFSWEVVQ